MKTFITLCLLLSFSVSVQSRPLIFGGDHAGNGGDAVVCRDHKEKILSAELLDYYEGRLLYKLNTQKLNSTDAVEAALTVLLKLHKFSPTLAEYLKKGVNEFMKEVRFIPVPLADIKDSKEIFLPKGCQVEQLAIQKEPVFSMDKRYTVNSDIWNALSIESQAGLILHEVIYRLLISGGATDSVSTRYYNSALASDIFLDLEPWQYAELARESKMNTSMEYKVHGYDFYDVSPNEVFKTNLPKRGRVRQIEYSFLGKSGKCTECVVHTVEKSSDTLIVEIPEIKIVAPNFRSQEHDGKSDLLIRSVVVKDGLVKGALLDGQYLYNPGHGVEDLVLTGYVEFYPNLTPAVVTLWPTSGRYFYKRDGTRVNATGSSQVSLDEDGYYISHQESVYECLYSNNCKGRK